MPKFLLTRSVAAPMPGAFGVRGLQTEACVVSADTAPDPMAQVVPDATEVFDWKPVSAAEIHALIYPAPAEEE